MSVPTDCGQSMYGNPSSAECYLLITLVTSLNQALFDAYGSRMMQSFETHAKGVRLVVVFEGPMKTSVPLAGASFKTIPFKSPDWERFFKFFGRLYEANGIRLREFPQPNGGVLLRPEVSFRYDLVRFSFKIFAIEIARAILTESDAFAWIDADVICLKDFTEEDLEPFFPHGSEIMSYLGRSKFPPDRPYSECGFLAFNPKSGQTGKFLDRMKSMYVTGEAFSKDEWHDSFLWDEVRREFETTGHIFKNISGSADVLEHPFVNCGLGKIFDHLKGPQRKKLGRSLPQDYRSL